MVAETNSSTTWSEATPAGEPMSKLHDWQPVILEPESQRKLLDTGTEPARARDLVKENPVSRITIGFREM